MILFKQNNTINYDRFNNSNFKDEIISFCNVILKNFDNKYLENFYNNINSLTVIEEALDNNHKNCYVTRDNTIYLESPDEKELIFHELFHMASSIYKDDTIYCGFAQWKNDDIIAKGLNEGYTQLLTERYFGSEKYNEEVYYEEMLFSKFTEDIVGKDKMNELFLTSNLEGLIKDYHSDFPLLWN